MWLDKKVFTLIELPHIAIFNTATFILVSAALREYY